MAKYNFPTSPVYDPLNDSESANVEIIESYSYFESLLKQLDIDSTLIVMHPAYEYLTFNIYRLISKYRLRYCVYNAFGGLIYDDDTCKDIIESRLRNKLSIKNLILALYKCRSIKDIMLVGADVFTHIPYKLLGINSPNYILMASKGYLLINYLFPIDKNTKFVWCHGRDYDIYLNNLDSPKNVKEKQVVYVSSDIFYCMIYRNNPEYCEIMKKEIYYGSLKRLFRILENRGYKIIVAAHPREPLPVLKQYLNEWDIIYGDTDKLIRESEFAIQLPSTSTLTSFLYNRPFIMITSDSISKTGRLLNDFLVELSTRYGKKVLNIDHLTEDIELEEYLYADKVLYKEYISDKIEVPNIPNLSQCEILINNL